MPVCVCLHLSLIHISFCLSVALFALCSISLPPPCLPPPPFLSVIQVRAEGSHQWQLRALLDQVCHPLMAVVGKIRPGQDSLWVFLGLWLQLRKAEHFSVLHVPGVCENRTLLTDQGREAPGCCTELLGEEREGEGGILQHLVHVGFKPR